MLMKIWTGSLLFLAWLSFCAWLVLVCREKNVHPLRDFAAFFKKQTTVGRILFGTFFLIMWVYASVKPGDGGGNGGGDGGGDGGTNNVPQMVGPPGGSSQMSLPGGTLQPQAGLIGQHAGLQPVQTLNGGTTLNLSGLNPITSTNTLRTITSEDFERGFVQTRVGTDEQFDFSPITNATIVSDWRAFGAATDWIYVAFTNWAFQVATNDVERLRVYAFGKIEPLIREADNSIATNYWFAPFMASLGVVPQANWDWLSESARPSQVWYAITPENSLVITWQNALLDRDTDRPLSFQVEFKTNGQFTYRYDLSRLNADTVTNILSGASFGGNGWTTNAIPTNVTSMVFYPLTEDDAYNQDPDNDGLLTIDELFFYDTDPRNPDTDYDGLTDYEELFIYNTNPLNPHSVSDTYCDGIAVKIGDADPFSYPEGSTNTVLEHVFYSGTTNGVFAYPQSSDSMAVLEVSVSGSGTGDLIVGNQVVPLVAPPQMRSAPPNPMPPLLVQLVKGETYPVYVRGDELLQVSLNSADFAFGVLPTYNTFGHINFPNTVATTPCIHDFNARRKGVYLPMSRDAHLLTCTWHGSSNVEVSNSPPRAATITGNFSARSTSGITYTLSHPQYLFGQTSYNQTVRFCPQPPDPDPEDPDPPWYSDGDGDDSDENDEHDEHWCCYWGTCDGWCGCGCDCGSGTGDPLPGEDDLDDECPEHSMSYEDCAYLHEDDYTNAVQSVQHLGGVLYIREPPFYEQIHLDVPTEHRNCCPCPDHWTNYVGVAYKSYRLRLIDSNGMDFSRTETSCDVNLAGVYPSSAVGDATLAFSRNGEIYQQHNKTVLGVAIKGYQCNLADYNALNSTFGYPMTVCTNVWDAPSLSLVTNVKLPNGHVHLELLNATGQFTVWYYHYNSGTYRKLLDSTSTFVKDLSLPYWRKQVARSSSGSSPEVPIYITSSSPGSVRLLLRYWTVIEGKFVQDEAYQKITSINPALLPDMNYDGNIDDADIALFLAGGKFRFWQNEDTIKGSYSGQIGGSDPNVGDSIVNGAYDLVNFFPMAVNFAPLINAWGNQVTYHIEPEWETADSFNFCWANIGKQGYRRMQSETVTDIGGIALENASVTNLPSAGYTIPYSVMNTVSGGSGMIVSEAKASYVSMKFTVKHGDDVVFAYLAPLSISRVKDMYRWLNIRNAAGDSGGEYSNTYTPWNRPDSECDDRHFVFVHGYNVNASQARQWANNVFKRLWWSGSRSRFTAVDWYGDDSQLANYVSPNYYINVEHALVTAPVLSSQCAGLQGDKTFIAHSLGNMVVSSAAKEHGLSYAKYYMVDAAVAMECYAQNVMTSNMVEHGWTDVPGRLWSANWYQLFSPPDDRRDLRWRMRFQNLSNAVNCYSPTEDVLENATPNGWGGVWSMQELFKGTATLHVTPGNCEGGWGYNDEYTNWLGLLPDSVKTNTYTDAQLMQTPIFRTFDYASLHTTNVVSLTLTQKAKVLGDGIPAVSFASGANQLPEPAGIPSVDMTDFAQDWPRGLGIWWHSDISDVAYRHLSGFYDMIVNGTEEVNE